MNRARALLCSSYRYRATPFDARNFDLIPFSLLSTSVKVAQLEPRKAKAYIQI